MNFIYIFILKESPQKEKSKGIKSQGRFKKSRCEEEFCDMSMALHGS